MPSYSSGGVIIDAEEPLAAATLDAQIGSIVSVNIETNTELITDDSGGIYDEGAATTQIAPRADIGSKAIAEVLSVIGVTGQCFVDAAGDPGVIVYGKNRGDCLTDVESNSHSSYTFANGLLTLGTLQADKGADATISFMVDAIYDGTNVPLVISHAATLPATLIKEQFEIGLCAIGGTQFKPESVTIDFGQQIAKPRALAPTIYPERIAVQKVQPTITFRGLDPSFVTAITAGAATHANTKIQLVKRLTGGSYVASATTQHIAFTAYGTVTKPTPFSAQGQADAETTLSIKCLYDGTNAPILFNTAVAYDTSPES
jgi:hypothetical protein